ncbi:MAG TPA: 6-phosphofructokinase [Oligoflexia bacterium]|nr:6-phosphofructokinase [Oligoflexia bacterium]HMP27871.1 6-phosphofructokinase [Oligoflexia bacterium]
MSKKGNFAIVVSGGPAPAINSAIASAAIEAINKGYQVFGLQQGFRKISLGEGNALIKLKLENVSSIHNTGGSILSTARFNPLSKEIYIENLIKAFKENQIDKLIIIGGEGSAWLAHQLAVNFDWLSVAHIPKTIDNDLILPNEYPSFGFETARYVGTKIIETLMIDAKTTNRWFIVASMGRKAGFLALGLGVASGATLTIIPEEFGDRQISVDEIAKIIFGSIQKRAAQGKLYGVAIVAEGILDLIDPNSSPALQNISHDELGRITYWQIELGDVILPPLKKLCKDNNLEIKIVPKNIGYELRCHQPVSFDIEYTRFLGYGAVDFLLKGISAFTVAREFDRLSYQLIADQIRADGTIQSRKVNLNSDLYKVARNFMIR